jgi:hypothetical protein
VSGLVDGIDPTLLPSADETVRCAVHAERIGLDPGGTALWVDELIVVDVPLPWPKPVWAKDGFTAVPELVQDAAEQGRRVRVLAAVPLDDSLAGSLDDPVGRVVTHRLVDHAGFVRREHHVAAGTVAATLESLLADGLDARPDTVVSTAPERELLLCTQGSHDVCCGTIGMAVHGPLAEAGWAVRRVSHTGGHRMAPTGVTLPDGRMWGGAEVEDLVGILAGAVSPRSVAPLCRGWMGAAPGAAQVAERAVMAAVDDWELDGEPRQVAARADDPTMIDVATPRGTWSVRVVPGRVVPTITCGAPGGLPAKPAQEWVVESVTAP